MAITQEQLDELRPEGFDVEQWKEVSGKFMAIHEVDINGLKNTNIALKNEKTEAIDTYRNAKAEWEAKAKEYDTNIASLNEQLAKNSPESITAAYEQQKKALTEAAEQQKASYEKTIAEQSEKISVLEKGVFKSECDSAFEKAIVGKNINSDVLQQFKTLALGSDYANFSKKDIGDGKSIITREDGKDIAASVDEFLSSPAGKLFVLSGNSGGGADGGMGNPGTGATMSEADFDKLTPKEKMEVIQKNIKIV